MNNLTPIPIDELYSRAKTLYFDRYPHIMELWADEFGRFDLKSANNLMEQTRSNNGKVFNIKKDMVNKAQGVETIDKRTNKKRE
jgi:hypothetical protein